MPVEKTKNQCIDLIKGVACILVVFMHCEFPGYLGVLVQSVSRFSVPFFFMVSGYFCYRKEGTDYRKKVRHIGSIILSAVIFYLIVTPLYQKERSITLLSLIKWLVFNVPPYIAAQLWFLFALLYDYLIFALLERYGCRKIAYLAIPLEVFLYIALAQGAHLLGFSVPNLIYRNFLIEGLPFFSLGYWIHEHQDQIRISNRALVLTLAITTLLCPLERALMGRDFGVNIVSFPQVTVLFLLGVKKSGVGEGKLLTRLGSKCSMYVYILHPAVMHLLERAYEALSINESALARYMLPVLCVILSVLCSIAFYYLNRAVGKRVKRASTRADHPGNG